MRNMGCESSIGANGNEMVKNSRATGSAHQMNVERVYVVNRTPKNYSDHVKEFLKMYGNFTFEITELIAENDKVYARWHQTGKHLGEIDGNNATGKPISEIASAVYRLENGKIVEYWIQIDRFGFEKQLSEGKNK